MGKRSLLRALVLVATLLAAPCAQAIVINARNYSVGTNLTNAIPGVTLEGASYDGSGPSFATSPLVIGTDAAITVGGAVFNTFGETDSGGYPPFQIPSNDGPWAALYAAFTVPVYSVSAVGFNEDGDPAAMVAYGANGQQLDVEIDNGGPLPYQCIQSSYPGIACLAFHEETVSSTTPISYVLFGSTSESTYYTEIDIPGISGRVPEPSSLVLFGIGLLASSISILRRR